MDQATAVKKQSLIDKARLEGHLKGIDINIATAEAIIKGIK